MRRMVLLSLIMLWVFVVGAPGFQGAIDQKESTRKIVESKIKSFINKSDIYNEKNTDLAQATQQDGKGTFWATYGATRFPPTKGKVIIVRKDGLGDFTSIQPAIDSIKDASIINTYTVLVFPGIYDEKVTLKNYISLLGTDRKSCKIISNQPDWVIMVTNGEFRDFYIENLRTSYPSISLRQEGGMVRECDIYSHAQDTVYISGGNLENCYLNSDVAFGGCADTLSVDNSPVIKNVEVENLNIQACVWIGNVSGSPKFYDCIFRYKQNMPSYGAVRINDNGGTLKPYFYNCKFLKIDNTPGCFISDEIYGIRTTVYHTGCVYSSKGETDCTYVEIQYGDQKLTGLSVTDNLSVEGITTLGSVTNFSSYARFSDNIGGLEFFGGVEKDWDTNLYRGGDGILRTDGSFEGNTLHSTSAHWKDWSALAAHGYYGGWVTDDSFSALIAENTSEKCFFTIPYETGTILSKLRIKWKAQGKNDGVKVRIIKRDESGSESLWSVVAAQQTYTDSNPPFDITVSTYELAEETMQENYSYAVEVESVVESKGVKLYSFGLETIKRIY